MDPDQAGQHRPRYGSDLPDDEWEVLRLLLPIPAGTGRRWAWSLREVINAIFFVLRAGSPWRILPEHFPPHPDDERWFTRFRDTPWERLNHELVMRNREKD